MGSRSYYSSQAGYDAAPASLDQRNSRNPRNTRAMSNSPRESRRSSMPKPTLLKRILMLPFRILGGFFNLIYKVLVVSLFLGILGLAGLLVVLLTKPELTKDFRATAQKVVTNVSGHFGVTPAEVQAKATTFLATYKEYLPPVLQDKLSDPKLDKQSDFIRQILIEASLNKDEALSLATLLVQECRKVKIDPVFAAAVIAIDSDFDTAFEGPNGELGLFQLDPVQGEFIASVSKIEWRGERELINPAYNLQLGLAYIKGLHDIFDGDLKLVLMAKKWGADQLLKALKTKTEIPAVISIYANQVKSRLEGWQRRAGAAEKAKAADTAA